MPQAAVSAMRELLAPYAHPPKIALAWNRLTVLQRLFWLHNAQVRQNLAWLSRTVWNQLPAVEKACLQAAVEEVIRESTNLLEKQQ